MTIHVDEESDQTISVCDRCGVVESTTKANGVVPEGWLTGHLWLDVSLSEQKQIPLCFCLDCRDIIMEANLIQITGRS